MNLAFCCLLHSLPHDFRCAISEAPRRDVGQPVAIEGEWASLNIPVPVRKGTFLNVENDHLSGRIDGIGAEVREVALDDE